MNEYHRRSSATTEGMTSIERRRRRAERADWGVYALFLILLAIGILWVPSVASSTAWCFACAMYFIGRILARAEYARPKTSAALNDERTEAVIVSSILEWGDTTGILGGYDKANIVPRWELARRIDADLVTHFEKEGN